MLKDAWYVNHAVILSAVNIFIYSNLGNKCKNSGAGLNMPAPLFY